MNTLKQGFEGQENRFAAVVKGAIVCMLMGGAVLIGSGMHRQGAVAADVQEAAAPAPAEEAWTSGYFPGLFPAPQGQPEPHIAQF